MAIRRTKASAPAATSKNGSNTPAGTAQGAGALPGNSKPTVLASPQSKTAAAKQANMTLHTDDSWSTPYWTDGDLHCRERKLFG